MQYVRAELAFALVWSITVYFLCFNFTLPVYLPFSVSAILGSALAIFIAFRNNSSYNRWWEARTLWGGIINSSRVMCRLIITFADSHAHQPNYNQERSDRFKKDVVFLMIAWVHALRLQLRRQTDWDELKPFMSPDDFQAMMRYHSIPNYLHMVTGRKIYAAMSDGTLGGFDSFQLEGQLLALANYQGGCERIKSTPLLRQYDYFTRLFMYTFIMLLPVSLAHDFEKMNIQFLMIPVCLIISFVFAIIGKVGEVNEDPFENRITDVPLTAICNTIERDLREMLGEIELPVKAEPKDGFLF